MTRARQTPVPVPRAKLSGHIAAVANGLFQAQGYAGVTMQQIASASRVSKRTLYKYFPVKEALLARVLEAALAVDLAGRDLSLPARAGFRSSVTRLLRESAKWCRAHADVLLPYIRYKFASFDPGATHGGDRGLLLLWTALVASAQARGELRADVRAEQLGMYFHYLYLGALMRWLTQPRVGLRKEFDTVVDLFVDGTSVRAPARVAASS